MEKSVIACGIVRNAERNLRHNMPAIAKLSQQFREFRMIIFENDSTDGTKEVLKHWQGILGDKLVVVSEDGGFRSPIPKSKEVTCNPFFSEKRISRMVVLRNQYLQYIEDHCLKADYLLVIDLDIANFTVDGIMSSFIMGIEWDAVCANCHSLSPKLKTRYHDTYALVEYGDENNPQTEEKILSLSEKYADIKPGDEPVRVYSAFGGISIYRFEAISGLRYKLVFNDDPRVEVRTEHFSIYKQMSDRGYTRTFINPAMLVKYQNLTLKIIKNSIKKSLGGYLHK